MKKLVLDIETLMVESFPTQATPVVDGTVIGHNEVVTPPYTACQNITFGPEITCVDGCGQVESYGGCYSYDTCQKDCYSGQITEREVCSLNFPPSLPSLTF